MRDLLPLQDAHGSLLFAFARLNHVSHQLAVGQHPHIDMMPQHFVTFQKGLPPANLKANLNGKRLRKPIYAKSMYRSKSPAALLLAIPV